MKQVGFLQEEDLSKSLRRKIAKYVGVERAVSCQSGTAGLHLAMRVLGIEPGDEVIVPTLTLLLQSILCEYMGARTCIYGL